ncbi:MAG: hypothetical protein LBJ15_15785 [Comamonas sp.]|jgi:hypothetical protein|uniref:I78 family peptidase inhibitor n=1 Tax=Comamonas sp. TaxID=34028 RepID=UPI00281AD035|nr:I78 family peptidase inhibitor [Comamonas sp.]MDR0215448.1 hypothetical protein [Comamonas sp.]
MKSLKAPRFQLCCSAAALVLLVAGCASNDTVVQPGTPSGSLITGSPAAPANAPTTSSVPPHQLQVCNAKPVQLYIGHNTVPSTLEMIRKKSGAYIVRVLGENQPTTMEFDQERLNVIANEAGKITALRCG